MLSLVALFTQRSEIIVVKRQLDALHTFGRHKRHHMVDIHGLASDAMGEALLTQRMVSEVSHSEALPPDILVDFLSLFSFEVDNMRFFSFFNFINSWHTAIYDYFFVYLYNKISMLWQNSIENALKLQLASVSQSATKWS